MRTKLEEFAEKRGISPQEAESLLEEALEMLREKVKETTPELSLSFELLEEEGC